MKSVKEEAKLLEQQHTELEARVEMYQREVQQLEKVHDNLIREHVKKEQMILQLEGVGETGISVRGRPGDGEKVGGAGGHWPADDQKEKEAVLLKRALKIEGKEKETEVEMDPADTQTCEGQKTGRFMKMIQVQEDKLSFDGPLQVHVGLLQETLDSMINNMS